MNNAIYKRLIGYINEENDAFKTLVDTDNVLGLNVTVDDIMNFLEFTNAELTLSGPLVGKVLITEGDVVTILKIIHDLPAYEGEYTLFINGDNIGVITYLVDRTNKIYDDLKCNVKINIDYSDNYNNYLNSLVTIAGSDDFVKSAAKDFKECNQIIM